MKLFELTTSLMNIPSVSGDEEAVGFYLRDYLESLGWTVELQAVGEPTLLSASPVPPASGFLDAEAASMRTGVSAPREL